MAPKSTRSATQQRRRVHFEDNSADTSTAASKTARNNSKKQTPKQTKSKVKPKSATTRESSAKQTPARRRESEVIEEETPTEQQEEETRDSSFPNIDDLLAGDVANTNLDDDDDILPANPLQQAPAEAAIEFDVSCYTRISCNKEVIFTDFLGRIPRDEVELKYLKIEEDANTRLASHIKSPADNDVVWKYEAVVQSHARGAKKEQITVDCWDVFTWKKVDDLMLEEYNKFKQGIALTCVLKASCTPRQQEDINTTAKKRPLAQILSSDPVEPESSDQRRRTRSTFLQAQNKAYSDVHERLGRHEVQLVNRYTCQDAHCRNCNSTCWIDSQRRHFAISTPQLEKWANTINSGEASIFKPPHSLIEFWLSHQGPIGTKSKHSLAHSERQDKQNTMDKLIDMQFKQMEMGLMKSITEQARMGSQEHPPANPYLYGYPAPPPPFPYPHSATAGLQHEPFHHSQSSLNPNPPNPHGTAPPQLETPRSSPPAGPEDELDCIHEFFEWKAQRLTRPQQQQLLQKALSIVEDNMWGLEDLRGMEDGKSGAYNMAIQQGMADGLARSFRRDLRLFKPEYRASRALQGLHNTM